MIDSPSAYAEALKSGRVDTVKGLRLRILKGENDSDFEYLVRPQWRKLRKAVMWLGDDGAEGMLEAKTLDEILDHIDYTRSYIREILDSGMTFKLLVCKDDPEEFPTFDATFEGLEKVLDTYYPEVAPLIYPHLDEIKRIGIDEATWQEQIGISREDLEKIHTKGPQDPEFVSTKKILRKNVHFWAIGRNRRTEIDLPTARRWLYNVLGLNLLWSGSGKMRLESGKEGDREYFGPQVPVRSMRDYVLIDLNQILEERAMA